MIPDHWKKTRLGNLIASLDAGVSVNGEDRALSDSDLGVLKVSAVSNGVFQSQACKAILKEEITKAKISPKADRIIISRSNTEALVGASAYISSDHSRLFLSDKLWQLEPNPQNPPHMQWLAYWLSSSEVRKRLSKLGTGTSGSMKNISKEELLSLQIFLPPLHEQKAIAQAMQAWDKALVLTKALSINCRMQWLAIINRHLMPAPKMEAVGNGTYPSSVQPGVPKLPPAPVGWRRTTLGEYLHEVRRPVDLLPETKYRLVTVRRSRGGVDTRGTLLGAEVKTPTQFFVKSGDFLISKRQIVHGACGIVPPELDGAVVSNEYAVLGTDGRLDLRFLRYLSETTYFQQTCFHSSIGIHVEKMLFRTEHWLTWPFNIPPLDEQRRIVALLDVASAQIHSVNRQLELLKEEKRVLMNDLLTGKRRLHLLANEEAVNT